MILVSRTVILCQDFEKFIHSLCFQFFMREIADITELQSQTLSHTQYTWEAWGDVVVKALCY